MREQRVSVPVGDDHTAALLRLPAGPGPFPLVVHGPGWMSTKDARHYERYHTQFALRSIATLVIDYRVLASLEPTTVVDPVEMVADLTAAVRYGAAIPQVDATAVVLLGTGGVGAGCALVAGARTPEAGAVVAVSPIATGRGWLEFMRTAEQMDELLERVARDRAARARGEVPDTIAPVGGISIPPAERAAIGFKTEIDRQLPSLVSLETVEKLLTFRPVDEVAAIGSRELLMVACRDDTAVPYPDALQLLAQADAGTRLVTLEGTSSYGMHHTHWEQIADEVIGVVDRLRGRHAGTNEANGGRS